MALGENMRYSIVIHKDPNSAYGVTVPDIPGCFSAGDTMDEAMLNATEAIECHIEGLLIDGEDIPNPMPMESHHQNPDFKDGIWGIVTVDLTKLSGKSKRINISIPERLLQKIDAKAKSLGENRSSFLLTAALEHMSQTAC
ncbi:MAG: type II toxin-antitoxin system HicB family antitoxin [Thermosynechococcaceae cyanobacterium]